MKKTPVSSDQFILTRCPHCGKDPTSPPRIFKETGETPVELFESLWRRYPRRLGKKTAARHFNASVKTAEDWNRINKALDNYLQYLNRRGTPNEYIQHGSRWFGNWADWSEYEDNEHRGGNGRGTRQSVTYEDYLHLTSEGGTQG